MTRSYNVRDYHREFGTREHFDVGTPDEQRDVHVPGEPPDHELELWQAWFAEHGIDPAEVLLTHWVERRAHGDQNEIVYLEDAIRDGEPITREVVVKLDRPPAPFPVP